MAVGIWVGISFRGYSRCAAGFSREPVESRRSRCIPAGLYGPDGLSVDHAEQPSMPRAAATSPADSEAMGHPLTRLQSLLISIGDLTDFLTELTKLSAELVPGVSCGITSRRDGQPLT